MTPELDVVNTPDFLGSLGERPMDELRAVRSRCQSLENALSYVRRLIQGRVDIVGGELQRRREGGGSGDVSELIGRLPDILSEGSRSEGGPGSVRPPHSMEPDSDVTAQLEVMLDEVITSGELGSVAELDEDRLEAALAGLNDLEDRVSANRKTLHSVIDSVQGEVIRRYSSGEESVDNLLK